VDAKFFRTPAEFRAWLEKHHATASEAWVGYYKKATGKPTMTRAPRHARGGSRC
jgi:uncharacterized protein YdeI (YjbR/CyaY-like superfamily)